MTIAVKSFFVKDPTTTRDDILRTIKSGLTLRGVVNPDVSPGTDEYIRAQALANELAVVGANTTVKADAQMPDSCTGADMDRQLAIFVGSRRDASIGVGQVICTTSQSGNVPVNTQLVDQYGLVYQVTVGGTYTNTSPGNIIPIQSVSTGKQVNHSAGDVLRWVTAPAYFNSTVTVNVGGITGGVDIEDDETARGRLVSRLQVAPGGGNWTQIKMLAEASSTSVQAAYVYPAVNGPSTVHVAVVGYAQTTGTLTATSKNRDVSATILNNTVIPYVLGNMPEYVETVLQTVTNQLNDVSFQLTIPSSPAAVPAGTGGGWIDGTPWPTSGGTACTVTGVTSSTVFQVSAVTAPTPNVSHICFLDPTTWTLQRAKVLSFTGTSGAYVITIDTPFPNIGNQNFIWPDCVNAATYVATVLAQFAQLGPGEKTANSAVLTRGYRHPLGISTGPQAVGAQFLRALNGSSAEVSGAIILAQSQAGPPTPPGAVSSPPVIWTPRNCAFYQT